MYVAVTVAFWSVLTPEVEAAKVAVVEPGATVTDGGTVRFALLLPSDTDNPVAGAAASNVTVQVEEPLPWRDDGLQDMDSK